MAARLQFLFVLIIGAAAGAAYGIFVLAPGTSAPSEPPPVELLGKLPAAPAPVAMTPVVARVESPTEDAENAGPVDEPGEGDPDGATDTKPLVPSSASRYKVFDDDITLVPRGPGRFAILDLRPIGRSKLTIRAGRLERDGGGNYANFARNRQVGVLRGRKNKVELLNLGFDKEGIPTMAHIRTVGGRQVEGVVSLRRGDRVVKVKPYRGEATSEEPF